jgi:hypothetical protein
MPRATRLAIAAACLSLIPICWTASPSLAQGKNTVNGVGLVDYYRKPTFKPGDWVRYRISGSSERGARDDYSVVVLIAGEEHWWGEDCFWVETITEINGEPQVGMAALVSYEAFKDSLAVVNFRYYVRKQITTLTETGEPRQEALRRPASHMKTRFNIQRKLDWYVDTLEVAARQVGERSIDCRKLLFKQASGNTIDVGDSSQYNEVREHRTIWRSLDIPITSIALEEIDNTVSRRTWVRGRSQEAPLIVRDRALGRSEVVNWGRGRKSEMVPAHLQFTLAEQRAKAKPKPKRG